MKVIDVHGSAASGSKGSTTASRNRGGQYLRNRAMPTNPNTVRQANVREGLGSLTPMWSSTLTEAQRDAWNLYASNVPVVDTLGQTIKLSGINMFVRSNAPRLQGGNDIVDDGPSVYNIGDTPLIVTLTAATGPKMEIQGTLLTPCDADFDFVYVYTGRPTNPGVSYFRGPYRYLGSFQPDPDTGEWGGTLDPASVGFPLVIGTKVFVRIQSSRADGRLSADAQGSVIIVA